MMTDVPKFPVKKAFLYTLVGSVGITAIFAIAAILSQRFEWFEVRVLMTTLVIASASICGLACGAYMAGKRGRGLPWLGVVLAVLAAAMAIAGIWAPTEQR